MNNIKSKIISFGILSTMLMSSVPVFAATAQKPDMGSINKPSSIRVMSVSRKPPKSDFSGGYLWCTADALYARDSDGNRFKDGNGGYVVMHYGESHYFDGVSDGRAYFTSWDGTKVYFSTTYLSTEEV
ncbi:hypothetical protein [Clostridium beijerinckii]|uniref:hypothetical protein n=1 Tax=Clostridium beijerinckii TaxID=1520 RepID=UPI00232C6F0C|nr:hypothetical protein [Clostridium beijerinckii]